MADARQIRELALLQRLMPPPAPSVGWSAARQQIGAQALGVLADDQALEAENALQLSAHLSLTSGTWAGDEYKWNFAIENVLGASGKWLDVWGKKSAVPRIANEVDSNYARRILVETTRHSPTNAGLAETLNDALGVGGSLVYDTWSFVKYSRYNDVVHGSDGTTRFVGFPDAAVFGDVSCTFFVVFPTDAFARVTQADVERIIARKKAAGTRLLSLSTDSTLIVPPIIDFSIPRPSRFGQNRTSYNQPRAYESDVFASSNLRRGRYSSIASYYSRSLVFDDGGITT